MNAITLILIQVLYPLVFLNIQVLPSSPTCGIYGHITFRFSGVSPNFELNEIYIQTDDLATHTLFRKTYIDIISSLEGHMLYCNNTGAKLINLPPNLNGARLVFKFQADYTGVEETVELEPLRMRSVFQEPISEAELKQYEYALHSPPLANYNQNLEIKIHDDNLTHPVNFIGVSISGYIDEELQIIELKNLTNHDSMINQLALHYNEETKILTSTSEYSTMFHLTTIIVIRKYHELYKAYTTNLIYIENPFTSVTRTGNHINWNLKSNYFMPLEVKLYLYFSNDTFQIRQVSDCDKNSICNILPAFRRIISCVSKTSFSIKNDYLQKITHLQFQLVINDDGFEGYTRTVRINSDNDSEIDSYYSEDNDTQKSKGVSTKTTVLITVSLLLLCLIIAGLTTFFVIRKKDTKQISKKSENDSSLKKAITIERIE